MKGFGSYLAEDFYDIFPYGKERTKSELLEFLSGAELKDYRLSNFRVTMLNQDAAIVIYHVDAGLNSGKRDFDEKFGHIRLGQTWWHVVKCLCCRFGPTISKVQIRITPNHALQSVLAKVFGLADLSR